MYYVCKRQLEVNGLVPWFLLFHLLASSDSPLQSPRLERHFCVLFVPIRFVIGELLLEVGSRVGHGLVLVCQDKRNTLASREIQLSVQTWWKR